MLGTASTTYAEHTLSQCEFSMGKTLLVYDMNLREMENYEKIYKEIGKETK